MSTVAAVRRFRALMSPSADGPQMPPARASCCLKQPPRFPMRDVLDGLALTDFARVIDVPRDAFKLLRYRGSAVLPSLAVLAVDRPNLKSDAPQSDDETARA